MPDTITPTYDKSQFSCPACAQLLLKQTEQDGQITVWCGHARCVNPIASDGVTAATEEAAFTQLEKAICE